MNGRATLPFPCRACCLTPFKKTRARFQAKIHGKRSDLLSEIDGDLAIICTLFWAADKRQQAIE